MNIPEAARRIQYVGRIMLIISAATVTLVIALVLLARFTSTFANVSFSIGEPIFLSIGLSFTGLTLLILGWIIEGLATPSGPDTSSD
jgi:hypothetical protein